MEQKDATLCTQEELLQQNTQAREGISDGKCLQLQWRDAQSSPCATRGHSVAVSGEKMYCCGSGSKVFTFNQKTEKWVLLPDCLKKFFSVALVNSRLTAIGGKTLNGDEATKSLLSLCDETQGSSQYSWREEVTPMTYYHNDPAVATTDTFLIVAGGWGPDKTKGAVEVLDIQKLEWFAVASLPYPLTHASATICKDRIYLGGGFCDVSRRSVLMCEVQVLLGSKSPTSSTSRSVWRETSSLSVCFFSLVTFQNQLFAVGRQNTEGNNDTPAELLQYNVASDSWSLISEMKVKRHLSLAAVFPNNTLLVCGGCTLDGKSTTAVELATIAQ